MFRRLSLLAAVAVFALLQTASSFAQSKCDAAKLKEYGKRVACLAKVDSTAAKKGETADVARFLKCTTTFTDKCAKAEALGDCTGNVVGCAALEADADTCRATTPDPICLDQDGDGYPVDCGLLGLRKGSEDCDDADPSVNPGSAEICDGKDNDCDRYVDEGGEQWFSDPNACGSCANVCNTQQGEQCAVGKGCVWTNGADVCPLDGSYISVHSSEACTDCLYRLPYNQGELDYYSQYDPWPCESAFGLIIDPPFGSACGTGTFAESMSREANVNCATQIMEHTNCASVCCTPETIFNF